MPQQGRAGRGGDPTERADDGPSQTSDSRSVADPLAHFHALTRDEQRAAIKRLSAGGMSDYGIAHATKLAVEQIRAILGEPIG